VSPWELDGRVALVTGAGLGIGRRCAEQLAAAGATVLCVSRTETDLEQTVAMIRSAGGEADLFVADVTEEDAVGAAVDAAERLGELRIAVTAAGSGEGKPARDYPMEDWDALFAVNVRGTFLVCRAVGDSMLRSGAAGSIVTVSSQLGEVGFPQAVGYCATKHAVNGITRALAVEWAKERIRVNAVAPTYVRTAMVAELLDDPEAMAEIEARLPSGRIADVDEVAHAVRFLACDAAGSTTGHILSVDGGWTAW
jgi:NAD(P)-dependent dehydrogenase (short-subunit alcohol dehydrogenase family)